MSDLESEYEVGYAKPPKRTQFKKGQSGNPKGRPKGAKGFNASLKREMESEVIIREGGREVKVSKAEAAAKRFLAKALHGDMGALKTLMQFDADLQAKVEKEAGQVAQVTAPDQTDEDVLAHFAMQVREGGFDPGGGSEPGHAGDKEVDP
ncbi:DUF5681 domain-containing protein [Leisingera sp. ANG-M1]|uniref:DUF5681 domain-containing protein n=1 Tax=Leisingera sp. ANG-M1 TaxID=1577895 RepID=UPI00068EE32F|nr:DUF5681 domain-containing protein [Leisingera sp. ANG-M1]